MNIAALVQQERQDALSRATRTIAERVGVHWSRWWDIWILNL